MSAETIATSAPSTTARPADPPARRELWRVYRLETWYELLKMIRMPAYALPTIGFPVVFYLLFGSTMGAKTFGPVSFGTVLLAQYAAFGVIGAALFGFGVGVAVERGQGWLLLKRASPMPVGAYFAAKITMALLFGTIIVALLGLCAVLIADVRLTAAGWLAFAGTVIAGALPFCAMGLAFGTWCGPNSAPAVVNLVYLPMSFASGLWMPIQALPGFMQTLAPALPPFHLGQLALKVVGADLGRPLWVHVGALAATTVLSLGIAWLGWRRGVEA